MLTGQIDPSSAHLGLAYYFYPKAVSGGHAGISDLPRAGCRTKNLAPPDDSLVSRWQATQIDGSYSYATATEDGPVSFSVIYPHASAGMARLYWDEPVADSSVRTNEAYLAQTITFAVR